MEYHNKRWTNEEILYLIESYQQGKETLEISNYLQRTSSAILSKLKQVLKKININYKEDYDQFIQNQINTYIDIIYKEYPTKDKILNKQDEILNDVTSVLTDIIDIIVDEFDLNEKQLKGYNAIKSGNNIFLTGQAGCHAYDSEILMYDGSIKKVQDIKNSDIIMGDDSTPRNIIKLIKGFDQMYKVTHIENNDSYIVNKDHILTLIYGNQKYIERKNNYYTISYFNDKIFDITTLRFYFNQYNIDLIYNKAILYFNNIVETRIIDISISDYLNLNPRIKNNLYGIKTGITFKEKSITSNPYIAGGMFGINTISYTEMNIDIYMYNSFNIRMKFLSGIIDTYGCVKNNKFVISYLDHNSNIDKIIFIIKSLNLIYKLQDNDIYIYDNIKSKKFEKINKHSQIKRYIIFKISVELSKPSMYYGFTLDNNHRYLTADMIITHNCGKTYIIKKAIKYLNSKNKNIGITGSTGVSATLIGGTTLHSFLGIGLGKKSVDELYKIIKLRKPLIFKKITKLEVLIIDEISMIDNILFCKIAKLISLIQNVNKPFGKVQLILCGDFGQIKPVNNTYCFEASIWPKLNLKPIILTEQIRQNGDNEFKAILSKLRLGELDNETYKRLKQLKNKEFNNDVKPTILYSLNRDIDIINDREYKKQLNKVGGHEYIFKHKYNEYSNKICKYVNSLDNKEIKLCVGLQVMITFNINIDNNLVNGTRCVITDIFDSYITVKTVDGNKHIITYITYKDEIDEEIQYEFIPLKLAYAISIHKSQGSTIDLLEMDLGSTIFDYGQFYTCISRGTSLSNIKLLAISKDSCRCHPKVIEFYKKLESNNE